MSYNFVEVPNTRGKIIDTITLTGNDYLSFPTFFVEKHKLKDINEKLYTRLFYDASSKAVAIQFTTIKDEGTYPVNGPEQYGATCKIRSFLLNNEIDAEAYAGKYHYKKLTADELGMEGMPLFVIELKVATMRALEEFEM
jgi:hypothetical protein